MKARLAAPPPTPAAAAAPAAANMTAPASPAQPASGRGLFGAPFNPSTAQQPDLAKAVEKAVETRMLQMYPPKS